MIYELTTLTAAPAMLKDVTSRLNVSASDGPAELVAAWTTEAGRVNDVLLLRRYEDDAAPVAATEIRPGKKNWLSEVLPMTLDVQIERFRAMDCLPPPTPAKLGPLYELRSYVYRPGTLDELLQTWEQPLVKRAQISPMPLVMYTIDARALRFVHLYAYQNFEQRLQVRAGEIAKGTWPPPGGKTRWLSQENALLLPLDCSPLK